MALRRPQTRLELKTDDIDEYNMLMREKEMIMDDSAAATGMNGKGDIRHSKWSNLTSGTKKAAAAERIGIGRQR
eukprot:CAMPEP_0197175682 /NCGR_PEP_ID=MMETSP1423-20130617/1833_1 /TAXON_ID=476441 /ORGANISM="Pseudo-nitzschia heimii, Strain UNC1101" /LENGTH=73 /DNA_ID=CAMNT_0042624895 /DNA_START=56 /DNA_END=277 /DNA_ORIENTATION=-